LGSYKNFESERISIKPSQYSLIKILEMNNENEKKEEKEKKQEKKLFIR